MKKLYQLFLIVTVTMLTACSTSQTGVYVGNFSNSECLNKTRSFVKAPTTKLKLTRNGNCINGEFLGYQANCMHGELSVDGQQEGNRLSVNVREKSEPGALVATCLCPINIYFTLFDVDGENFDIFVNEKEMGNVTLKENGIALFDTYAIDNSCEKGAEYPPVLYHYYYYSEVSEETVDTKWGLNYIGADNAIHGIFQNFYIPCDAEKIDLKANIEDDGSLIITSFIDGKPADGKPSDGCMRRATIQFLINNALKDSYHIKVNPHKTIITGEDGSRHEEIVCDFEGDLPMGQSLMWN